MSAVLKPGTASTMKTRQRRRRRERRRDDRRLPPGHRCAEAERHRHDVRAAGHSDHRPDAQGAGRGHARHLVPPRAACRQRRRDRRLSDRQARHLPDGVGARLPQRPDRARQRDDQLLPDDPHQRLERARDRRPAAGRLRGDGPARDRQALCKAAYRVLHAEDIGIGIARAIRAAVSGRPGGVYLDLPAKLFAQAMDAEAGRRSLMKVVDPAPRQMPAPDAVQRALDLLKGAKRPLIVLGKGAAYARADAEIRALIEKTGIPYLPMSMAKGLLPDTHAQSAAATRSYVLRRGRRRRADRRAPQLAALARQGQDLGRRPKGFGRQVHPDRHLADRGRQQRADRGAAGRRHRLVRRRAA